MVQDNTQEGASTIIINSSCLSRQSSEGKTSFYNGHFGTTSYSVTIRKLSSFRGKNVTEH